MEAAVAAAGVLEKRPDVFLVLGTALASTLVDGRVNWGLALVRNLAELRRSCPESRLVIVLPKTADNFLVREIVHLGIYDVHRVDKVRVEELLEYIENPRTFADAGLDGTPKLETGSSPLVEFAEDEEEGRRRWRLPRVKLPKLKRLSVKAQGNVLVDRALAPVQTPADMLASGADAFFVPSSWGAGFVAHLRRATRAPIVVVGGKREFLDAGADRCVRRITPEVVEEVAALAQKHKELWDRAEIDPLTGCYTRAFGDAWFADHARHAAVAVLDLDHFKAVNDAHGHAAGDAVLKAFGSFLRANVRGEDVVVRYGGEEFVVGMPHTSTEGAHALIDRLRETWSLQEVALPNGERVACTFSAGVASGNAALERADRALYQAKAGGRNGVRAAEPQATPQPRLDVVRVRSKVVTVLSPWIPGCPVAEVAVEAAQRLARDGSTVGLIDAAVRAPGVSRLLGIPDTDVWEYDWRVGGVDAGLQNGNLLVWPLDPLRPGPADEDVFLRLVEAASGMVDRLIVSGGSDPDLVAGHALVLVTPCPNLPEIVRAWNYFRPVRDGSLVLVGDVDPSGFGLPLAAVLPRLDGDSLMAVLSTEGGYAHAR